MAENLASGNSINFQFDADDYITINGNAQVIASGLTASVNTATTGGTFGPYPGGAAVRIIATGALTYTVTRPTKLGQFFEVAMNPATGAQSASPDSLQVLANSMAQVFASTAVSVVGDSLAAYGDGIGSGGSIVGPTSQSIPAWALSKTKVPYHIASNRGVGGALWSDVLTNQLVLALTDNTDILWIHVGINNLNPAVDATAPTVAQITQQARRVLDIASVSKALVILDAVCPLDPATISGALPRRTDIPLLNAAYRSLAAEYKNVLFNDVYTPMAQDATSGLALPSMTLSTDGIHLTTLACRTLGAASYQNLRAAGVFFRPSHRPTNAFRLPAIIAAGGTAGTKTANSGTINGTVADDCNVTIASNSAGVVVDAAVSVGRPGSQRLRIQNGNAAASVVQFKVASATAYITGLASGDLVRGSGRVEVIASSSNGIYRHDFIVVLNTNVGYYQAMQKSTKENGSGGTPFPLFGSGVYERRLFTPVSSLSANATAIDVVFTIEVAPGGDVTVDLSGWTFEEVVAA